MIGCRPGAIEDERDPRQLDVGGEQRPADAGPEVVLHQKYAGDLVLTLSNQAMEILRCWVEDHHADGGSKPGQVPWILIELGGEMEAMVPLGPPGGLARNVADRPAEAHVVRARPRR